MKNIYKQYGDFRASDNVSFGIEKGKLVALLGPSGSGKTTLMRIILGLEQPDSGNISGLGGKKTAVVFQNDRLLPWLSALDNVAAVCSKERAKEMLEKVELSDALNKKPAELSGGMCRRVALARALAFDADILLLDEPFKGLDTELRGRIVKLVEDFAKTKPVILITHDPWEVSLAKAKLDIEK